MIPLPTPLLQDLLIYSLPDSCAFHERDVGEWSSLISQWLQKPDTVFTSLLTPINQSIQNCGLHIQYKSYSRKRQLFMLFCL